MTTDTKTPPPPDSTQPIYTSPKHPVHRLVGLAAEHRTRGIAATVARTQHADRSPTVSSLDVIPEEVPPRSSTNKHTNVRRHSPRKPSVHRKRGNSA